MGPRLMRVVDSDENSRHDRLSATLDSPTPTQIARTCQRPVTTMCAKHDKS